MKPTNDTWVKIGKMVRRAMETRRDRPKLAVAEFIEKKLDECEALNIEPKWKEIIEESRKIWEANK